MDMKKEDAQYLLQLVTALETARLKLEEAYNRKDYQNFTKVKNYILEVQKRIEAVK